MNRAETAQIQTLKIVSAALFLGAATFLGVVVFLLTSGGGFTDSGGLGTTLLGVWAALVLGGLVAWPIVRNLQARQAVQVLMDPTDEADRREAAQHYSTATIVGAALAESTALLAGVSALITGRIEFLFCAAPGLIAMLLLFPSQQKFERFLVLGGGRAGPTAPS